MIMSAASSVMNYQQQKKQAKYRYAAQVRQNKLARENAIQRAAAETLKIRQITKQKQNIIQIQITIQKQPVNIEHRENIV